MSRMLTGLSERDAYLRTQEATVLRERQRAARRAAQLRNVKSVADPSYVACLEKVALETLAEEELSTFTHNLFVLIC